ncbi:hypothetical protein L486_05599 [Kwoniella mangroviensis CBS 10435]|uniref:Uncharacterized protein n=1 Tax=Kwoniella mangroviensis CBS 10435 TaxID=1331196 RepID=A0A1B9IMD2_9TREE|nr:hypothetical protein L486_05599 [Kwoniella mangroviensis CBS 10435]
MHLPRQHALLILRQSLQQKLRHLLRTLRSDDITELVPATVKDRDRTLLGLPATLGGIGLSSHRETAPLAYQAATALATKVLAPIVDLLEEDSVDHTSQRELCREAAQIKQTELLASLHFRDRMSILESSSQLGRKWLLAVPTAPRFTIPDPSIQANLCYRTLASGYAGKCRKCAQPNTLGHDEWCTGRKDYRTSWHEAVKHHLAAGLRSIPSAKVVVEPFIDRRASRKNDIKVVIDDGLDRPVVMEENDLKVVSLFAPTHQASLRSNGRTTEEKDEVRRLERERKFAEDMEKRMLRVLAQQARRKVTRLPEGREEERAPFCPLVISTGGYQDEETRDKLREWKNWKMPGVSYTWMLTSVSVALAKARGRSFLGAINR